jgi:hypothetical protein
VGLFLWIRDSQCIVLPNDRYSSPSPSVIGGSRLTKMCPGTSSALIVPLVFGVTLTSKDIKYNGGRTWGLPSRILIFVISHNLGVTKCRVQAQVQYACVRSRHRSENASPSMLGSQERMRSQVNCLYTREYIPSQSQIGTGPDGRKVRDELRAICSRAAFRSPLASTCQHQRSVPPPTGTIRLGRSRGA